mmetsp:Transcript_15946/g.43156  ORF Transcript_15946/g.43156 Transcript_15946/m.43156 type:complete len:82 (+) Transcript_15946:296-541(+)
MTDLAAGRSLVGTSCKPLICSRRDSGELNASHSAGGKLGTLSHEVLGAFKLVRLTELAAAAGLPGCGNPLPGAGSGTSDLS